MMPDESQGFQKQGTPGEEASQVSLVPDIMIVSGDGKGESTGGNILELENLGQNKARSNEIKQSGLSESQASVEVGVAKTAQAPEPLRANSLLNGTGVNPQVTDNEAPVDSSSDRLQSDSIILSQTNSCSDSDYSSTKSSPGYTCTSFSTDLCDEELHELDGSLCEKTNPEPYLDASQSNKNTQNIPDNIRSDSKTDLAVETKAENTSSGSSPASPDGSLNVYQTRNSIDVRWDEENRDEDQQSTRSRRTVKEGMCCCYQTFHRAFLRCVEETPAMLSGLVLSLAFSVAIIVLISTIRLVRHDRVCVSVC